MTEPSNPFRKALEGAENDKTPVRPDRTVTPVRRTQMRTVAEMHLVPDEVLKESPKIAALTVRDLNDLALEFSGVPSNNELVSNLSLDDIQDIEGVFYQFKVAAGRDLIKKSPSGKAGSVDVSCCCCTPCCCCAATDMSHTA